jgi:glycosyltransferase involved in cell wall biosynthesis
MNIIIYVNKPTGGGAEKIARNVANHLARRNEVYFVVNDNDYGFDEKSYSFKYVNLNFKFSNNFLVKIINFIKKIIKIKTMRKKYNIGLVISFSKTTNLINVISKSGNNGYSYISVRTYKNIEGTKLNLLNHYIFNRADKIISCSKLIENEIINKFGFSNKLLTIYNPININETLIKTNDEVPKEFIKGKDKLVISTIGRISQVKGHWHMIKIFHLINKEFPNSVLYIIGEDRSNGEINELINRLGLRENVVLTGYQENPFKFLKLADIYFSTSINEGFPNNILEALALGKIVVSTDCKSGPREILNPTDIEKNLTYPFFGEYGILINNLNPEENYDPEVFEPEYKNIASLILSVNNNLSLKEKYRNLSSKRAKDFSHEKILSTFDEMVNAIGGRIL